MAFQSSIVNRQSSIRRGLIITIDGPSGTGKSTAARGVAKRLGYLYLDTGALYRAAALAALQQGIPLNNPRALAQVARRSRIDLRQGPQGNLKVSLNGRDVTRAIRAPRVSEAASVAAAVSGVRRALLGLQRKIAAEGSIVAEGRDTGTIVFPKADLKIFLTASPQARAKRRAADLRRAGFNSFLSRVLREMAARDARDRLRKTAPLRKPRGAVVIDNTWLQSDQVVDRILFCLKSLRKEG